MPFSIGLGVAGLALNGINEYSSYRNQQNAQDKLNSLNGVPLPRFAVNPAIQRYYQSATGSLANPYGYTSGEKNAYLQNLNQVQTAQTSAATNFTGGNLGKAISFIGANGRINGLNQFTLNDAQLRRQYMRDAYNRQFQGAQSFQNVDNQNTQAALQRRLLTEQALGGGVSSNRDYQSNLLGNVGTDLLGAGAQYGFGNRINNNSSGTYATNYPADYRRYRTNMSQNRTGEYLTIPQ